MWFLNRSDIEESLYLLLQSQYAKCWFSHDAAHLSMVLKIPHWLLETTNVT